MVSVRKTDSRSSSYSGHSKDLKNLLGSFVFRVVGGRDCEVSCVRSFISLPFTAQSCLCLVLVLYSGWNQARKVVLTEF